MSSEKRDSEEAQATSSTIQKGLNEMNVTMTSKVLVRVIKTLSHACGRRGEVRSHLCAVWFRAIDGNVHAWATNGHWLAGMRIDEAKSDTDGLFGIERTDLAKVLAVAPTLELPVTIAVEGTSALVDFKMCCSISVTLATGAPPAHTIVPDRLSTKKHARAALNVEVLGPALSALREATRGRAKTVGARFYAMGPSELDPQLMWSAEAPEFFAYLMPMRSGGKRDMRWWFDAAKRITEASKVVAETSNAAE